jgi:hypothetical protein
VSNNHIRPTSIEGIKQLAKRLKRAEGVPHTVALHLASQAAGFENFKHAKRVLGSATTPQRSTHVLYISVPWRDREKNTIGREVLKMLISKPLDALIKPAQYKAAHALRAMRREASDHIADTYTASSQQAARAEACAAARNIQFMEATGWVPSNANRSFPRGKFENQMPGSDHDSAWFDPVAKAYIRANEPYSRASLSSEQRQWAAKHGWALAVSPWKGMYRPDGGTSLFLAADASKGYSLEHAISKLATAPAPIVVANWDGESKPFTFVSPAREAKIDAKSISPKARQRPRGTGNSVRYSFDLSVGRRPKGRMPIEGHKAVGRLLKSVLVGTRQRAGVHSRVGAIRCELDNWVGCEYKRGELPDEVFFDLYYHRLPEGDPLAVSPASRDRHIASLAEVAATLTRNYPECPPLRTLVRKVELAIASLQAWNA